MQAHYFTPSIKCSMPCRFYYLLQYLILCAGLCSIRSYCSVNIKIRFRLCYWIAPWRNFHEPERYTVVIKTCKLNYIQECFQYYTTPHTLQRFWIAIHQWVTTLLSNSNIFFLLCCYEKTRETKNVFEEVTFSHDN